MFKKNVVVGKITAKRHLGGNLNIRFKQTDIFICKMKKIFVNLKKVEKIAKDFKEF